MGLQPASPLPFRQICPATNLPAPAYPGQARYRAHPRQARSDYPPPHPAAPPLPTPLGLRATEPMNRPLDGSSDGSGAPFAGKTRKKDGAGCGSAHRAGALPRPSSPRRLARAFSPQNGPLDRFAPGNAGVGLYPGRRGQINHHRNQPHPPCPRPLGLGQRNR